MLTTLAVFAGSFGYANTHLYVTNAPLQPATLGVTSSTTSSTSTAATRSTRTTTTFSSGVRTTTVPALTKTASS